MSIKSASGNEVNSKYLELAMTMIRLKIRAINFDYSGSGDSGSVENITPEPIVIEGKISDDKEYLKELPYIEGLTEDLFYEIVNPNFNNSGSYGNGVFLLTEDGKLIFQCSHSDIIETTEDTVYDDTLIDTSDL